MDEINVICCAHQYFNKWEGEYLCMDCWYKLSPSEDAARIQNELEKEAATLVDRLPECLRNGPHCFSAADRCGWALKRCECAQERVWVILSQADGLIRFFRAEDCAQAEGNFPHLRGEETILLTSDVEGEFRVTLQNTAGCSLELIFADEEGILFRGINCISFELKCKD